MVEGKVVSVEEGYGALEGAKRPSMKAGRKVAIAGIALAAIGIVALAGVLMSTGRGPSDTKLLTASGASTDLDPGSLRGLEEAAGGNDYMGLAGGATARLGQETEAGELEQLQEKETTQSDRRKSDQEAPALRSSLGKAIAKYFTTVRSVKDDQGTFLG
mmetsp:Transcript_474/g.994  ORF Transcript_474/g.994 Transcript_474/m.994 type:complete len:159 (-) Transcript_474:189-665(-)|eukprot:CAMPEP_0173385458 /NCGR_PEP_ID=MMETSP1356-20130122/8066_1 /TAXON_ID=77927 ORGANISM="Hemiselmis virescens, Strain PCC157" /NCGR_SAMPLE_ID=MMETSP1356 /ASSEMBLY_ACC=CAM_ASM_000847 /LENGTH=158 /DNA_ID=CAMNT_0014341267 /DNA_START=11 /DNA_END=487 /DNA_ORIENTATION=-